MKILLLFHTIKISNEKLYLHEKFDFIVLNVYAQLQDEKFLKKQLNIQIPPVRTLRMTSLIGSHMNDYQSI